MNKRILIIGNGSGGHFYPSYVVAKRLEKEYEIHYIVSKNRIDEKNISKSSFSYLSLPYLGLNKDKMKFVINQINNIYKIYKYIKENNIEIIIGFGGGLSFSSLIAGKLCGCKLILHEQNAILGRANNILKKLVKLYVSHKSLSNDSIKFVGNPIVRIHKIKEVDFYDVVIVFGSQGSSSLNKIFIEYLNKYDKNYRILFICKEDCSFTNKNISKLDYTDNLIDYFYKARLVFTRGGATTLAELSSTSAKVCIIPSPYVINNHQFYNALEFEKEYGANIIEEKSLSIDKINQEINKSLNEFVKYNERKKIEKNDYLEMFVKEIENEIL